jgi:hypothetical protein
VATTVVGPARSLLGLLAGASPPDMTIHGDPRPVVLLQSWLKRAQSG